MEVARIVGHTIIETIPTPAAGPAPPATSVAVQVERWDGGSGSVAISNGVFFEPGQLTTTDIADRKVAVTIGGVEQQVYVEALDGRWSDGSVKSALIQFSYSFSTPVAGTIGIGSVRGTTDITKQALNAAPEALLYPTSTTHLCASYPFQPWEKLIPFSSWPTGSPFDTYRAKVQSDSPYTSSGLEVYWSYVSNYTPGSQWLPASFSATYNPGRSHLAWFCQGGTSKYLYRGIKAANWFLSQYANPNTWGIGEQYRINIADATFHYWMTGDTTSRIAPKTVCERYNGSYSAAYFASVATDYNNSRQHATFLIALVLGHHLGLANPTFDAASGTTWAQKAAAWKDAAKTHQTAAASIVQNLGATPPVVGGEAGCNNFMDLYPNGYPANGDQPWQVDLRNLALIMFNEWVDSSDEAAIQAHIEANWNYHDPSHWRSGALGYTLIDKRANGGSVPTNQDAPDVNGFPAAVNAWLIRQGSSVGGTTRGDQLITGRVNNGYWPPTGQNMKQLMEALWGISSYVSARQGN